MVMLNLARKLLVFVSLFLRVFYVYDRFSSAQFFRNLVKKETPVGSPGSHNYFYGGQL